MLSPRQILLVVFYSYFSILAGFSQSSNRAFNTWYFGNKAGLNFNTNPPSVLYGGQLTNNETASSVSDNNTGRILFYTNGIYVWDSTHNKMPHGDSTLKGRNDSEQGDIVPFPGHPGKYFIFTTTYINGAYYSIVDMSLNSGKGDLDTSVMNVNMLGSWRASDKITYARHSNKKDYWVIAKECLTDTFYVYLLDSTGLHSPNIVKIGKRDLTYPQWGGVLKFNRQGTVLVNCQADQFNPLTRSRFQGFSFDPSTGSISGELFTVDSISFPYGIEFSPDNKKLYVAQPFSQKIIQYDLTSSNIKGSGTVIFSSSLVAPGQLQIGPDNKIYVPYNKANYDLPYRYLGVINNPNASGTACSFSRDAIGLSPNGTFLGLPYYAYDTEIDSSKDCCAYIDSFSCKTLTFNTDSSHFCVPIVLSADTGAFKNNGFYYCITYDTTFVHPTQYFSHPYNDSDFTISIDSLTRGKLCVTISNVHHVVVTSKGEINLGCIDFVLHNDPFNASPANYFDYLSFNILDGCNKNLEVINAWLTEDLDYWSTEDNGYWKMEQ